MDIIAQAKEDLRQEQLIALGKRILPWAALTLALVIGAVAVRETWQAVSDSMARSGTEKLMVASTAPDSVPALLAYAEKDKGDRAAIAQLIAFQRMSPADQKETGLAVLDGLAADAKAPKEWRDFAALTATRTRVAFGAKAEEADTLTAALQPITADPKSPWYVAAQVETALIEGELQNNPEAAAARLAPLDAGSQDKALAEQLITLRNHYAAYAKGSAQ